MLSPVPPCGWAPCCSDTRQGVGPGVVSIFWLPRTFPCGHTLLLLLGSLTLGAGSLFREAMLGIAGRTAASLGPAHWRPPARSPQPKHSPRRRPLCPAGKSAGSSITGIA